MTQLLTDEQIEGTAFRYQQFSLGATPFARTIEQAVIEAHDRKHHIDLTNERVLSDELVNDALRIHHLPTDKPSQLSDAFKAGMRYAERRVIEAMQKRDESEPVATVTSFTNGSYHRNYKITWHKDVAEGTKLYAAPPEQGSKQ